MYYGSNDYINTKLFVIDIQGYLLQLKIIMTIVAVSFVGISVVGKRWLCYIRTWSTTNNYILDLYNEIVPSLLFGIKKVSIERNESQGVFALCSTRQTDATHGDILLQIK